MALAVWLYSAGVRQCYAYVTKDNGRWAPVPTERTQEYDLSRWLAAENPQGRVYVSGGLRFRINSWFDLQQVGGTFETGLQNRVPVDLAYQIRTGIGSEPGQDGPDAAMQLRVLGSEYVVVHGSKSEEYYRDFTNPKKFDGILSAVHQDGDDTVYRIPFNSLARLVRPAELPSHPTIHGYLEPLHPFTAALDDPSRPKLRSSWRGASRLEIEGEVPGGMLIAVSVNWDQGWRATENHRPVPVEADGWGFILIRPAPAPKAAIVLTYHPSLEQISFACLSALAWLVCLRLLWRGKG
jgi:hypothetical protein